MDRLVWVGAFPHEDNEDVRSIVSAALEAGFDEIVLAERDESLRGLGRFSPILLKGNIFFFDDAEIGRLATIRSAKDETALRSLRSATKHIVIRTEDWKIIPLENLIAHFQGSETRLLVEVHDAAEAKLVFETMEVGVHGILLVPSSPNEIRAVRGLLESVREDVSLVRAAVISIRPIGLGDRVCVDTCSLLRDGEGMLVGNSTAGLFLVHAETVETGYVAARPFRVNAGAVHAYIYLPGGQTKYLSELRAGDEVLAVDSEGRARAVIVGRIKVERRPLLLLEAEADGLRHATIVQNAETIRFVTPDGGSVAVGQVKAGDEVLLRVEEGGRHFGMRIRETIAERGDDEAGGGDPRGQRRGGGASGSNSPRKGRGPRRASPRLHAGFGTGENPETREPRRSSGDCDLALTDPRRRRRHTSSSAHAAPQGDLL